MSFNDKTGTYKLLSKGTETLNQVIITAINNKANISSNLSLPSILTYINTNYTLIGISANAFKDTSLVSINNDKFVSIDMSGCNDLFTSIGSNAFQNCVNLETVIFNKGLKYIHEALFTGCENIKMIDINSMVYSFNTSGNSETTMTSLVQIDYVVPIDVNETSSFKSVINKTLSVVGGIKTTFPNLETVFARLTGTASSNYQGTYIETEMCRNKQNLKRVVVEAASIRNFAFSACTNLKTVEILSKTVSIATNAFFNSNNIEELIIRSIALTSIYIDGNFNYVTKLQKYVLDGVVEVKAPALFNSVFFDVSLNEISNITTNTFKGFTNMKKLYCTYINLIGASAFQGCSGLTDITLMSVKTITTSAFAGCTSIQNIILNEGCLNVVGAFSGCTAVSKIYLPQSLTE